jgi:fructosamine-3-kinase
MHDAGASTFGVGPDGWSGDGFFGPLDEPLPLPAGRFDRWGEFYARCRLEQVRDLLAARGSLTPAVRANLERVVDRLRAGDFDDGEQPSRVHGDLWSGNVMWTADGVVLIDPAAHGGHRLADLAMLELFGLPFLSDVLAAYDAEHRLPTDWADAVGLHQLYPLGMHAVLFGGGYVRQLAALVEQYV